MLISKENNRRLGIVLQYLQMGLSVLISFIYTPIMLRILGSSEYGIYNLANSIISYLNLLSLGFGASYIRFYSRYKSKNDLNGISNLNGLFLMVFVCIGFIALISGIVLSNNVSIIFNDTYSTHDKEVGKVLMIIMAFNLAWSFPASVFTSYVTAQEKFIFQKMLNMTKTILGPFLTLPLLLLGYGSIGMVTITTVVTLSADLINIFYCINKIDMRFSFSKFDMSLLKEIYGFSIFIAINQIIDQINWATDKVILGRICNGTVVAYYSIGAQINTYFTQFSTAISSVYVPEIHKIETSSFNNDEKNKMHTDLFTQVGRLQFIILSLILTGFVVFGQYFISIWAGKDYTSSYYVALLLMTPALVPLIQNIGIEVQRAKNMHQFRSVIYFIMAIINIVISIQFAKQWGEIGAALGTTISLVLANVIAMNIFYHKKIGIDIVYFWKQIFKLIPSIIVPFLIMIILCQFIVINTFAKFGIGILLYIVIYLVFVYFIGLKKTEKDIVKKCLTKVNLTRK